MSQSSSVFEHQPVLLAEVSEALAPCAESSTESTAGNTTGSSERAVLFVDATYGRGGHARHLLSALGPLGRLVVIDRDPAAIRHARAWARNEPRVLVIKGRFGQLRDHLTAHSLTPIDALLVDLGVSSPQLEDASRGFSFRLAGPLDMRMDNESGTPLTDWLDSVGQAELARVLVEFGELPRTTAARVAEGIIRSRQTVPIDTTQALAALVRPLMGRPRRRSQAGKDPATGVFQALRMHINKEVDELEQCLEQGFALLREAGRMAVISFHSIEDRIVKRRFRYWLMGDPGLARLPIPGRQGQARSVIRLAVPDQAEIKANPRARSARLRVIEKCAMEMAA